jgi:hypothetical protein
MPRSDCGLRDVSKMRASISTCNVGVSIFSITSLRKSHSRSVAEMMRFIVRWSAMTRDGVARKLVSTVMMFVGFVYLSWIILITCGSGRLGSFGATR